MSDDGASGAYPTGVPTAAERRRSGLAMAIAGAPLGDAGPAAVPMPPASSIRSEIPTADWRD